MRFVFVFKTRGMERREELLPLVEKNTTLQTANIRLPIKAEMYHCIQLLPFDMVWDKRKIFGVVSGKTEDDIN